MIILFFLLIVICSFSGNVQLPLPAAIAYKRDSLPNGILIINAFDAMSLHNRKNKKELFRELADSLKQYLYNEILYRNLGEAIIFPELLKEISAGDSSIFSIMSQKAVITSIVIRNLDVFFEQTGVEVTKEEGGKKRVVSYDICSVINYDTYRDTIKVKSSETKFCEFFTKRNVISGLFAGGPDVVGKSKYTFEIVNKNAARFLLYDFPGK